MNVERVYTKEIRKNLKYNATWLPGTPIELGDIGTFSGKTFTKKGNLSDLGIDFEIEHDRSKDSIQFQTEGSVSIHQKLAGEMNPIFSALPIDKAGIGVKFSKDKAILFKANGLSIPCIKNQIKLAEDIKNLYQQGKWEKEWIVVTETVNADSTSIIISSSKDSSIELEVQAKLDLLKFDIADASLEFGIRDSKNIHTNIIADEDLTPLFKTSKLKGFKDNVKFKTMRTRIASSSLENEKESLNIDNKVEILYLDDVSYDMDDIEK